MLPKHTDFLLRGLPVLVFPDLVLHSRVNIKVVYTNRLLSHSGQHARKLLELSRWLACPEDAS